MQFIIFLYVTLLAFRETYSILYNIFSVSYRHLSFVQGVQNKLINVDESIYIPITRAEYAVLTSAFNV